MLDTELAILANDVRLACQRVSRRVRFESTYALPPHQASALWQLKPGPLTPRELAERERVSAPSITRTMNCLVEKGFVARSNNPDDGRSFVLTLTPEGLDVTEQIRMARDDWMVKRLAGLTPDERKTLHAATKLLNRAMAE